MSALKANCTGDGAPHHQIFDDLHVLRLVAKHADLEVSGRSYIRSKDSGCREEQAIHDDVVVQAFQEIEGERTDEGKIPSEAASAGDEK